MTMKSKMLRVAALATLTMVSAGSVGAVEIPKYDPTKYSNKVTGCDLLAGHPQDPHKVVVGIETKDMDLPAAVGACKAAVERDPTNPRLNYQLGRSLGYSGLGAQALPYREVALAAGYPQAVMVYGFLHLTGWNEARLDKCLAGELHYRSARDGLAAERFVWWALDGAFDGCATVKVDNKEMLGFLDAADKKTRDAYPRAINEMMRQKINARMAKKK